MTDDITRAVEAAAQKAFEISRQEVVDILGTDSETARRLPHWDEVRPVEKLQWRQRVLPLVQAAIAAMPDWRRTCWIEGWYTAGGGDHDVDDRCPYPLV